MDAFLVSDASVVLDLELDLHELEKGVISPVRRLRGVLQLGLGDTLRSGESAGGLCV